MAKYKIYSKAGCIFCDAAMELLEKHNLEYEEIKVTNNEEAITLFKQRKWKTVPQIFDREGIYVGGYHDLKNRFEWPDNPAEIGSIG
jgi:glutaredoxin